MKKIPKIVLESRLNDLLKYLSGEFKDHELEESFFYDTWTAYKKTAQISLLIGGFMLMVFVIVDLLAQTDKWRLLSLISVRGIGGAVLIYSSVYIYRARTYFPGFPLLFLADMLVASSALLFVGISADFPYIQNVLHGLLLTLIYYQFVHSRFSYIMIGCACYPVMFLIVSIMSDQLEFVNFMRFILFFLSGNAFGILILRSYNQGQRANYLNQLKRQSLNAELQTTLDQLIKTKQEVKVLQGLLPICANCKKIRDDKGNWNHLESYIQHHSEATFTHGICPACADLLYPEFKLNNK
jgi:hypothetical protein